MFSNNTICVSGNEAGKVHPLLSFASSTSQKVCAKTALKPLISHRYLSRDSYSSPGRVSVLPPETAPWAPSFSPLPSFSYTLHLHFKYKMCHSFFSKRCIRGQLAKTADSSAQLGSRKASHLYRLMTQCLLDSTCKLRTYGAKVRFDPPDLAAVR